MTPKPEPPVAAPDHASAALDALLTERQQDKQQIARYEKALRKAPMPIRESTLTPEPWDDAYDKWWHENASEAALAGEEDA